MSSCRNGGRFTHRWTDQVWRTPKGREVHVQENEEHHDITVHYKDGSETDWPFTGRLDYIELDGRRQIDAPEYRESCEVIE